MEIKEQTKSRLRSESTIKLSLPLDTTKQFRKNSTLNFDLGNRLPADVLDTASGSPLTDSCAN